MRVDFYQSLGIVCGAILALLALLGLIWKKVILPMIRALQSMIELRDELMGEPAQLRPDGTVIPARPSLMVQVAGIRHDLDAHKRDHEGPQPAARPVAPNGRRR